MSNKRDYTIETMASSSAEWGVTQSPFSLVPFAGRYRRSCVPYVAGPRTATEMGFRLDCSEGPSPVEGMYYTEIVDGDVYGTIRTQIGSIYLEAGTISEMGVILAEKSILPSTAYLAIRRFSDYSLLASFSTTSDSYVYVSTTSLSVPTSAWYDIYLWGFDALSNASVRGIYYTP